MNKFLQIIESIALVAIVIGAIALPGLIWDFSFDNYIKILDILIWPLALLISISFFRKVFTYTFFNLDQFNFFGTKGELKKIEDVIKQESLKLYNSEKKEEEMLAALGLKEEQFRLDIDKLKLEKTSQAQKAKENQELVKELFKEWKKTIKDLSVLREENVKLRNLLDKYPESVLTDSDNIFLEKDIGSTSSLPNEEQN